ncbi:hypothetical protein IQ06DRAFT_376330 [Phaeosphaeriaceae sp. SRC1lsM3a]|nr:hypothetical protein IQ06DRAFT_376330 [Stagonospora sp. SRC1lsM3a]
MADYGIFKHVALDFLQGRIRLLLILPDLSKSDHIQCQIWNDTTDASYTCLSYTWGSEHHQKDILINDRLYQCRENLWEFLNIARKKYSAATAAFWIDAICIDQSNVIERNHQVSQMGHIYSSANRVLIWLGHNEEIARFLGFMKDLVADSPEDCDIKHVRKYWYQNKSRQTQTDWYAFLACTYWTRAWITQEIFLSKSSHVLNGNTEVGIDELEAIHLLFQLEKHVPCGIDASETQRRRRAIELIKIYLRTAIGNIGSVRKPKTETEDRVLLDLAFSLSGRGSQEPRDQIYSLRAIAQDGAKVAINYQISDLELLLHTIKALRNTVCFCSLPFLARILGCTALMDDEFHLRLPDITLALPTLNFMSQQDPSSLNRNEEYLVTPTYQCLHVFGCHLIVRKDGSNLRVSTKLREELSLSISEMVATTRKQLRDGSFAVVDRKKVKNGVPQKPDWDNKLRQRAEVEGARETVLEISMPLNSWIKVASAFEDDGTAKESLCKESCWGWDSPLSVGLERMVLPA